MSEVECEGRQPTPLYTWDGAAVHMVISLKGHTTGAVERAAYRLAASFSTKIDVDDDATARVALLLPPGADHARADTAVRMFLRELVDEDLREKIRAETASLRALLLAVAFSRADLDVEE